MISFPSAKTSFIPGLLSAVSMVLCNDLDILIFTELEMSVTGNGPVSLKSKIIGVHLI